MKSIGLAAALTAVNAFAAPPAAVHVEVPVWFVEQITVASVDSGSFIASGQAAAPAVTIIEFSSERRCLDWIAKHSSLHFGVDQPMGTGSYFARIGVIFSECAMR